MTIEEIKRLLKIAQEQGQKTIFVACEHSGTVSLRISKQGMFCGLL